MKPQTNFCLCRSSAEKKEEEEATPDMTWLFDAAHEGRVEPILEYAQSENPNLDVRDSDGNTLLHWAVLKGKTTLVSALVDHGVDINALNTRGVTALFYASMLGDGSMVSLLVEQGARVNLHSMGSEAPTEHEVTKRSELIDIELEKEIKLVCTPVQAATVQGHFRVVLFLVQKGADVNIPAHSGNTALHYACMKSYVGLASFLVESGAALDARNDAGAVPADVAEDGMKDLLFEAASPQKSATAPAGVPGETEASTPKKQLTFNDDADIKLIERVGGDSGADWYKEGPGPWVFGKMFLDTFTSKEWKTRVAALKVLIRDMHVVQGDELLLYKSACAVLDLAFNDKVAQVYLVSLELLRKTLAHFAAKLDPEFLQEPMKELMATVIPFTGKSQEKVRNESFKAVLFVARQPAIGPAGIADLTLTQKAKKDSPKKWRPLYGRLKILAQMVFEFKFSDSNGLTIGAIMDFAAPAFEHQNEQVRKAAVDLFVEAYMLEGAAADGYIATLKPQLQVMIRDELASIDAPVAPVVAERPPPTASRLTDDTATSRPVTAGARPTTGSAAAAGEAMPYAKPIGKDGEAATAHITEFFDDETARCFVAKGWQSRVAALQKIEAKLTEILDPENAASVDKPGTADAAYKVVYAALRDPVPHVYTAALGLLKALAAAPTGQLDTVDPGSEVLRGRIVRAIVAKLGDRNARIRTRTEESLQEMARLPHPYGVEVIANYTLNPTGDKDKDSKGKTEPQLKLLCTLIQQFGLPDDGALSLESVMGVTVPAFEDRDKKVRKVAVGVYVSAWKRVGSDALLPYVKHLKASIRKVLKAKTEGKATTADNAGADGVNDGGIMFFNADEFNNGGGGGDAGGGNSGDGAGGDGAAAAAEALPYASSLPDDLRDAVKPLAQVFGDDTMQCFYSKQWAPREAALRKVEGQIRMMDGCDRRIFLYVVFMLESALADKIAHVLWGGLSLLRTVVANYAKDLAPVEVQYSMEKLMPNIITQLGNSNTRTRQACEQTCQFLSWKPNVGGAFIARHILSHDHGKNVTALENKALLLAQLVNDFGVGDESISAEDLFTFTRPCFEHRNAKVREAAVKIYVAAHKFIGAATNDLIGEVKPSLRAVLSKAAMDDPHTNSERPKTPAAFIFDRPSTAAERLSHSLALGGVGLSAAPILAQAGIGAGSSGASSGGQVSPDEEEAPAAQSGELDVSKMPQAQPQTEREKALALERATDAELNELTGLSGSLEVLKRVFGADLLLQFRDKDSSEREEALESMQEAIWSNGPLLGSEADANASFEACCHLAKHALSDKSIGVICGGLELLKTVIVTHSRKLGAFEFRLALGSLATTILGLSADGPIRVRGKSDEMAVFLAHQPKLGITFLSRYLLENAAAPSLMSRKDSGRAVVLARLKLLCELLGEVAAPGTDKSQWPMESVATFCAACIAVHTSVAVKNKAKLVAGLVCSCAGEEGVGAVRRLINQPPTSDPDQRKRVTTELEAVLAEHAGERSYTGSQPLPPLPYLYPPQTQRRHCLGSISDRLLITAPPLQLAVVAEKMQAEGGASNGPPRGVADPKFKSGGGGGDNEADLGRARSAVASSRGNEPGAPSPLPFPCPWLRRRCRPITLTLVCRVACVSCCVCVVLRVWHGTASAEEGAARPTTFGGAVGGGAGAESPSKPFSGLGGGAVLGDLPPITLGLPTGVANEFGR